VRFTSPKVLFTTLNEWLDWQQTSHPKEIDLGLERVAGVAATMGLLQPSAKVITVAGTNGKGSCVAALEAIIGAAGKRCGAFTSPHLIHYRERIRIDSIASSDADLCAAFAAIDQARGPISLTYFEFSALAAFYLFQREPLDYWLLEVGLGGRLDATNILDTDIAIVTSIDIDHVEWLGDNREVIGREKAGIFRAAKPVVCADPSPPLSLLEHAERLGAPVQAIGRDFGYRQQAEGTVFWSGQRELSPVAVNLPLPSLAAAYHVAQMLGLLESLGGSTTNDSGDWEPERVFADLTLAGRMQWFSVGNKRVGNKRIVLDVAHNPAAMVLLAQNLDKAVGGSRLAVVVAMMRDKDIGQSLAPLLPLVDEWAVTNIQDLPRAASAEEISACLPLANKRLYVSVAEALDHLTQSPSVEVIVVTGSFYTVAAAQAWLATVATLSTGEAP
jgi:dihydrofolate synthase / folylpolyglutamate synthase